jgi:hypothetical protein
MMLTPTAIETEYAGCLFRSRLEARWAVFFDKLDVEWEYEPQGYHVGGLYADQFPDDPHCQPRRYLPDFYLPGTRTWVEVKGSSSNVDPYLLADCVDWGLGLPGTENSLGTKRGLLLLGPIPRTKFLAPTHLILQHHKGGYINECMFGPGGFTVGYTGHSPRFDTSDNQGLGRAGEALVDDYLAGKVRNVWNNPSILVQSDVLAAYRAARSARFEHGQSGGVL